MGAPEPLLLRRQSVKQRASQLIRQSSHEEDLEEDDLEDDLEEGEVALEGLEGHHHHLEGQASPAGLHYAQASPSSLDFHSDAADSVGAGAWPGGPPLRARTKWRAWSRETVSPR